MVSATQNLKDVMSESSRYRKLSRMILQFTRIQGVFDFLNVKFEISAKFGACYAVSATQNVKHVTSDSSTYFEQNDSAICEDWKYFLFLFALHKKIFCMLKKVGKNSTIHAYLTLYVY